MKLPFGYEIVKRTPAPKPRKAYKRAKKTTWPCGMRRTKKNTKTFANGRQVCKYHYDAYNDKKRNERAAAKTAGKRACKVGN